MKKYLTDNTNNFIADTISNIHLALCFYSSVGWLSGYHSRILVFLLPTMMFNWLMDDDNCWMTRLENFFRTNDSNKQIGFINKKMKENGVELIDSDINKLVNIVTYLLFLLSYQNSYSNLCYIY